ncbi:NAD-dependent epimerase/dehydratase family protein [Micromonospora sp. WMMD1082]|uniref:NAD-dependent epimerase/dehydratase family protein n=1 Tax=Micromonospora sp. WMMD1082 TaxID=3016104 RepID=UPI002416D077|nr:NAD-dependent epimerase/dehydratase family protein [Micromonospora sp. WMMD1082]MDG4795681.1 NAD-dependent epimerase/dehydratase family protein [Micromonospora sp. WMMD1082]
MDNDHISIGSDTRALVTGGHGFVGSHLVDHLVARGAQVTVLDVALPDEKLPTGVGYRVVDLRDPASVRGALTPADVVFHLAGNASGTISVDHPRFDFETNAEGTFNLLEGLLDIEVRRVVYLSSAMVYGRPQTHPIAETHPLNPFLPYAASKLSGEHVAMSMVESYGLPAVVARAFTIYGPREDPRRAGGEVSQYLRWHLNGLPIPVVGDPDAKTRDFSHIDDLMAGLIQIAERGTSGECYNLGSGTETSMRELARLIGEVTGTPARIECDRSVLEDSYRHVADISRLRALGHWPRVPLAEGVTALAALLGDRPELPAMPTVFQRDMPAPAPAAA